MADAGRVIAGSAKGVRLAAPGPGTRPLADRVKQTLFAVLEPELEGAVVLDLFAGSGAGGIEALSRGAPGATFVERDGKTCAVIGANLRRTHLEKGHVVRADVVSFLQNARPTGAELFRACLVDPPYGEPILQQTLDLLGDESRHWLTPDAIVVAKHFWRDEPALRVGRLVRARERRFGETTLSFYTQAEEAR